MGLFNKALLSICEALHIRSIDKYTAYQISSGGELFSMLNIQSLHSQIGFASHVLADKGTLDASFR